MIRPTVKSDIGRPVVYYGHDGVEYGVVNSVPTTEESRVKVAFIRFREGSMYGMACSLTDLDWAD